LCIEYAGFQVVAKVAKTLAFALVLLSAGKYASLSEWFVRKVSEFLMAVAQCRASLSHFFCFRRNFFSQSFGGLEYCPYL